MSSRPNRFLRISDGRRISDQLSNYDDNSPTAEDQSKILKSQQTVDYSHTNGNVQSPLVSVPLQVKENILKVCEFWPLYFSVCIF